MLGFDIRGISLSLLRLGDSLDGELLMTRNILPTNEIDFPNLNTRGIGSLPIREITNARMMKNGGYLSFTDEFENWAIRGKSNAYSRNNFLE